MAVSRSLLAGIFLVALTIAVAIPVLGKWNAMMPYGGDSSTYSAPSQYNPYAQYGGYSSTYYALPPNPYAQSQSTSAASATVDPNPYATYGVSSYTNYGPYPYNPYPSQSTSAAPDSVSCFICQYNNTGECENAANDDDCRAKTVNYGWGPLEGQCTWYTPRGEENPRCVSEFLFACDERVRNGRYDNVCYTTQPLVTNQEQDLPAGRCRFSQNCNPADYVYSGHSGPHRCGELFDNVLACVDTFSLTPDQALAVNFINNGCSTFANEADVNARAEALRQELIARGLWNFEVAVTGHQASSSTSCQSLWTISITAEDVTSTYGRCHTGEESLQERFCFDKGERRRCQDLEDQVLTETCCDGPEEIYRSISTRWEPGDACPVIPCAAVSNNACTWLDRTFLCVEEDEVKSFSCCRTAPDEPLNVSLWREGESCPQYRCEDYQGACGVVGRKFDCTDAQGVLRVRTCCVTRARAVGIFGGAEEAQEQRWRQVNTCPEPISTGVCGGFGDNYYCSTAINAAMSQARICLTENGGACAAREGNFFPETCREVRRDGGGLFSNCRINVECQYECTPRPLSDA